MLAGQLHPHVYGAPSISTAAPVEARGATAHRSRFVAPGPAKVRPGRLAESHEPNPIAHNFTAPLPSRSATRVLKLEQQPACPQAIPEKSHRRSTWAGHLLATAGVRPGSLGSLRICGRGARGPLRVRGLRHLFPSAALLPLTGAAFGKTATRPIAVNTDRNPATSARNHGCLAGAGERFPPAESSAGHCGSSSTLVPLTVSLSLTTVPLSTALLLRITAPLGAMT